MSEIIKVGMADYKTCYSPDGLITLGLGSCVGVALRDPVTGVGGLAHVMLPDSSAIRNSHLNRSKFADTCIEDLLKEMIAKGASPVRLVAKIAGGATMFSFDAKSEMVMVGERNVAACKSKLRQYNIAILAEDTGANYGRTVTFFPETGEFHIRAVGKELRII